MDNKIFIDALNDLLKQAQKTDTSNIDIERRSQLTNLYSDEAMRLIDNADTFNIDRKTFEKGLTIFKEIYRISESYADMFCEIY